MTIIKSNKYKLSLDHAKTIKLNGCTVITL
jgi:hypothetical protein